MAYTFLGIKFAPLNIPLERRLQTLSVLIYILLYMSVPLVIGLYFVVLFSKYYWVAVAYAAWMYYDIQIKKTPARGGRRIKSVQKWKLWRYIADYFPISLVKTAELDPEKNYLFGFHPHGVASFGVVCNFATEANGFSEQFQGITMHPLTLKLLFKIPLLNNIPICLGFCDVSKESLHYILTQKGKGNAALIVIGGAVEALDAKPGIATVVLRNRKGFVKAALTTGTSLVPVFSFGENDLFYQADNPAGSRLRRFQETFKNIMGFSPPLFYGRGVFNYTFGLIPFRKPVNTVVGAPIDVPQIEDPSPADVDLYHQKYMDALCHLYDENKTKYGTSVDTKLLLL